jgi:hypothetical protein
MNVRNFSQLCEMLNSGKVKLKMSKDTHKCIIGIGLTIDPELIPNENLPNKFDGIAVVHDDSKLFKSVEFVPTFTPRIGDGFTINIE